MARAWRTRLLLLQRQRRLRAQRGVCAVLCGLAVVLACAALGAHARLCNETHRFQYVCEDDADDMPGMRTCPVEHSYAWNTTHTLHVECRVHEGVLCDGPRVFTQERPCFFTNGVVFEVALCLSALAGCLGLDRCYLGYPTLGFLKFTTCGGFLAWWLLDLVLIAAQIVGPADGSSYAITTSVPRLLRHVPQNHTVFV